MDPRDYLEIYLCEDCDWEGISEAQAVIHTNVSGHHTMHEEEHGDWGEW